MNRLEKNLIALSFVLVLALISFSFLHKNKKDKLKTEIAKKQHIIDSLKSVDKCYCIKLQFLDTLTDAQCEKAFRKSRGRLL